MLKFHNVNTFHTSKKMKKKKKSPFHFVTQKNFEIMIINLQENLSFRLHVFKTFKKVIQPKKFNSNKLN
jgi:hypothetical protein